MFCKVYRFCVFLSAYSAVLVGNTAAESPIYIIHETPKPTPALLDCSEELVKEGFLSQDFALHSHSDKLPPEAFEAMALSEQFYIHRFLNFETEKFIANGNESYQSGCVIRQGEPSLKFALGGSSEKFSFLYYHAGGIEFNEGIILTCKSKGGLYGTYNCPFQKQRYYDFSTKEINLSGLRSSFKVNCESMGDMRRPLESWESLRTCRRYLKESCASKMSNGEIDRNRAFFDCINETKLRNWRKGKPTPCNRT